MAVHTRYCPKSLVLSLSSHWSSASKCCHQLASLCNYRFLCPANKPRATRLPVECVRLICQYDAAYRFCRNWNFKGIPFCTARNWTAKHERGAFCVPARREHQCRPPTRLFVSTPWRKSHPHDVASIGYVRHSYFFHISEPTSSISFHT